MSFANRRAFISYLLRIPLKEIKYAIQPAEVEGDGGFGAGGGFGVVGH